MEQTELIVQFEKRKEEIRKEREEQEKIKTLSKKATNLSLENRIDKIEKQISHRELIDQEFRASIMEAAEKRSEAKYRDLIDASDKMKKLLNIIDGTGNGQEITINIQSSLLRRYQPAILEGEIINKNAIQEQITNEGVLCEKRSDVGLHEVGEENKKQKKTPRKKEIK